MNRIQLFKGSNFLYVLVIASFLLSQSAHSQTIVINEFMSSNDTTLADEDGDFSDWIELYNSTVNPVNLEGYHLSDDETLPQKWTFPAVTIQPGGFILVWASGKNKVDPGAPLHTNFSISSLGEVIMLRDSFNVLLDSIPAIELSADQSFGCQPDGSILHYFFTVPTPGVSNATPGYTEILKRPDFSASGGFYDTAFNLVISHEDTTVQIIYTLDGSEPREDNFDGTVYHYKLSYPQDPGDPFGPMLTDTFFTKLYESPIPITDQSGKPNDLSLITTTWHENPTYFPTDTVFKGVVVRARAIKAGALASPIKTRTFFVTPEGGAKYDLPVISFTTQENYLFDYYEGLYVAGADFDDWRTTYPNYWVHGGRPANYNREGNEWEYPAYLELFEPGQTGSAISQNVGFRMHGAYALANPMKTFRIYARDLYGPPTLNHQIFPELPYDNYKRILIRNSGQDFFSNMVPTNMPKTMMKGGTVQSLVSGLRFDTQAYRPCIVFINGEYWGIQNLRERYDKYYLERVYGIDPNNIDYLEEDGAISEGDDVFYNEMWDFLENHSFGNQANFDWMETRIDMENFMDYQIANIFLRNLDWPGNNLSFWRLRTPQYDPEAPYGHDGRFRWLMYDMDIAISGMWTNESYTYNALERALDSSGTMPGHAEVWATLLLRRMTQNEGFKNNFINRFADLLNTTFLSENFLSLIAEKKQAIAPEIQDMRDRWNYPDDVQSWEENVAVIEEFAAKRPAYQRQHIMEQFGIADTLFLTLDVSNDSAGYIRVNTINVKPGTSGVNDPAYPWTGIYFEGIPIELEAVANNGWAFSHWVGASSAGTSTIQLTPTGNTSLTAVFVPASPTELIHYWMFDQDLPNDTPFESINPTYNLVPGAILTYHSALAGYPFYQGHPNWRKASLERRNAPTEINYRPEGYGNLPYDSVDMKAVQVKQPFSGNGGQNTIYLHLPSIGYENLVLRFAAIDEGAADSLLIDYSISSIAVWKTTGMVKSSYPVASVYQLYEVDFTGIPEVNDNADFTVRIRFWGPNMTIDNGDRVTFNNFSLDGREFTGITLFNSKSTGNLNNLTTWGLNEDGTGVSPASFSDPHQIFCVRNRESVILNSNWNISGIGSRVLIGNGTDSLFFKIPASFNLDGSVDLASNAVLEINNSIPDLEFISGSSTIIYAQSTDTTDIPIFNYGSLVLKNAVKRFIGNTTLEGGLTVDGATLEVDELQDDIDVGFKNDLTLINGGTMSDSCYLSLNFYLSGINDQNINGDTNLIKCHNFEITKTTGNVRFMSDLKTGNSLNAVMSGSAVLYDMANTLTIGNSIEFHGLAANYNFTGTIRFDGNDAAGPGVNNQNIRGSSSDFAPKAEFNNIELAGHDEKRFRPSSGIQDYIIKGNLVIDSTATDRIKFYQNRFNIKGNIIYNSTGTFEADEAIFNFNGTSNQNVELIDTVVIRKVTMAKTGSNLVVHGMLTVLDTLAFTAGKIVVDSGNLIATGIGSVITGYNDQRYVSGPLGRYIDNSVPIQFNFPIGKSGSYQLVKLMLGQTGKDTTLYVLEHFNEAPPSLALPADLDWVSNLRFHQLRKYGAGELDTASITLEYNQAELGFAINLLRVAFSGNTAWENLEGVATGGPKGTITSGVNFTEPGLFALARYNIYAPADRALEVEVILEGPYDTLSMMMSNSLNLNNYIPLQQPFNVPPWYYEGEESVMAIPNNQIIDWVLVELRDAPSAEMAQASTTFDKHAGFLLANGHIVGLDGSSDLTFTGTTLENIFVVVWQRNHLGIISSNPLIFGDGHYEYDFSTDSLKALGGSASLKLLKNGVWGMKAGDMNADGFIDASDKISVWYQQVGAGGYQNGDTNLDGQVDNNDKNKFWQPNLGSGTQVPE